MSRNRKLVKKGTKEMSVSESVGASAPAELTPEETKKVDEINKPKKDWSARRYCLVINNPLTCSPPMTHETIKEILLKKLTGTKYFCMADEIGEKGTPHTHLFVIFENNAHKRFSVIKNNFPNAHIEKANGTLSENIHYVKKDSKWKETSKADTSIPGTFEEWGELPKCDEELPTGRDAMLERIQEYIEHGLTPKEIMTKHVAYTMYDNYIKKYFFIKRNEETPVIRKVDVTYLVGASGTGKSYTYYELCNQYGEENVYLMSDYANGGVGGLDGYYAQQILFMDEYKSSLPYAVLLKMLDEHKADLHARYANVTSLWSQVYITSVFPVEQLYKQMVEESSRKIDTLAQLYRRINKIVFCAIDTKGDYYKYEMPMKEYKNYNDLITRASRYYMEKGIELICEPINTRNDTAKYQTKNMDF